MIHDAGVQPVATALVPVERRKHVRLSLQIRARLYREVDGVPIQVITSDVSINGFCCLSPEAFQPGEAILSVLTVSALSLAQRPGATLLLCRSEVLRVAFDSRQYRVACHFRDYRVIADFATGPVPVPASWKGIWRS